MALKAWEKALSGRKDLDQYKSNSLGLFALALRFGIDDIHSVAADSLTDGNDDKKCDLIYINDDAGAAVIAQCYASTKPKRSAPSNKASDLATASGWLLHAPHNELPDGLKPAAIELRKNIHAGSIEDLHIWYVHNLPESENVEKELRTVQSTVSAVLKANYPGKPVKVHVLEVGTSILDSWYRDTLSPILVSEEFSLEINDGFEVATERWNAYVTTTTARFLHDIYKEHSTRLFSANVRDYLGARKSDANINHNIMLSAQDSPHDFWVYNNGLTILVNDYNTSQRAGKKYLHVKGLSIVNGAQTTGALGNLARPPDADASVPVRFVKTSDADVISNIIRYNNSQNRVTAPDFRSTDRTQRRLREEIAALPDAEYQGGRRGGEAAAIRRSPNVLPSYTVGQALAAFHGDPVLAYNRKSEIWASDRQYSRFFNEHTTGVNIVFVYALLRAIEKQKHKLFAKVRDGEKLTSEEETEREFFRQRGATYLMVYAIAACLETILERAIPDLFVLSFGSRCSPLAAEKLWEEIVSATVPFCRQLGRAFDDGLNSDKVREVVATFQSLVASTARANAEQYREFGGRVIGADNYPRATEGRRAAAPASGRARRAR